MQSCEEDAYEIWTICILGAYLDIGGHIGNGGIEFTAVLVGQMSQSRRILPCSMYTNCCQNYAKTVGGKVAADIK